MKIKYYSLFLVLISCLFFACTSDKKPAPVVTPDTPTVVPPKPGTVATPADISRPDKMTNNFQRLQGEWQLEEDATQKLQIRGKVFLEIKEGANKSELANQFKVVENCKGGIDLNGEFFMVGNRCFKILKISVEEMELENMDQQKVVKYIRI